jgi:hypothetical protein
MRVDFGCLPTRALKHVMVGLESCHVLDDGYVLRPIAFGCQSYCRTAIKTWHVLLSVCSRDSHYTCVELFKTSDTFTICQWNNVGKKQVGDHKSPRKH